MIADLKPDQSVAIQRNSDDVSLGISYDVNSARNSKPAAGTATETWIPVFKRSGPFIEVIGSLTMSVVYKYATAIPHEMEHVKKYKRWWDKYAHVVDSFEGLHFCCSDQYYKVLLTASEWHHDIATVENLKWDTSIYDSFDNSQKLVHKELKLSVSSKEYKDALNELSKCLK